MRWHSGSDKELNQFFKLLSANEEVFANGQARLVLTAAVFHRSLEKLEFMRNSRKMKTREEALQIKKVLEQVVDLKLSHYDLDAEKRRMSTLRGTLDVQIFRRLQVVTLQRVPMVLIENLATISWSIKQLRVHRSIYSLCELRGSLKDASNKLFHPKWPSLEVVDLSHNWLCGLDDSIQMFASSNLHSFIISYNRVENFYDYLTYLPVVKRFDASFNQLSVFPIFAATVYNHLSKLVLCANQLTSLRSVSVLFYLEYLDVRDNLIARHIDLSDLKSLHILKHILLAGNPLCSHEQHFTKTINQLSPRALINCPVIDDNRVSSEHLQQLQSRHQDLDWRGILDGNSVRSTSDVQMSSKSTASADRNSRLPSIAERLTSSKSGSVSSSTLVRKDRANSGIRIKKAATFSHKSRPVQLTIPGHLTDAERMFQTSTPKSQKRLQKKASLTSVSESPVRFLAETEGDAYIQSYRSMKENMETLGIKKGILNDLVPDDGQGASSSNSRSPKLVAQDESVVKNNPLRRSSSTSQRNDSKVSTECFAIMSKQHEKESTDAQNDLYRNTDDKFSKSPIEGESDIMDNSEHDAAKGHNSGGVFGSETVQMRPKDASKSSVSSNRDSRISQHSWSSSFFPNSFTQDGSNLCALSNEMDGFVEPIFQLEHRLHLHLSQQVLEDFEDFQQLFKGYLSTSQQPEIKPCALVVTSVNIRFFQIIPTEEKGTSLDQVDCWFKSLASFPFDTLLVLENGISDQSLHFKFKNSASAYVFVAFSRDLILNLVDVIIRWCLKYSYVNYTRSEKTLKTDMKLLDKLVLIKLKSGSVLSGHQSPRFETFSTSFEMALKENSWLCRFSRYDKVLCILTATEQHVCICAVNYFVVHTAADQLKSKPFVLLDARPIPDIRIIVRYRNRRNVLSLNLFDKAHTSMTKQYEQKEDQSVWNIKLGNMKQVSDFVNVVRQKWESVYCTNMENEVAAEPDSNVVFFDDYLSKE